MLSLIGHHVNAVRIPFVGRRIGRRPEETGGFWDWLTRTVMRYPAPAVVIAGGLLIAAAIPYLDINTGFNGVDAFPDGTQAKEAFLLLEQEFSFGVVSPTEIVIDGDIASEQVQEAMDRLAARISQDPDFAWQPVREEHADVAVLSVPARGESSSDTAVSAIRRLRAKYIPVTQTPSKESRQTSGSPG